MVAQGIVHHEQLVDAKAAGIAGFAAFIAPFALEGGIAVESLEHQELAHVIGGLEGLFAVITDFSDQALCQYRVDRGADEVGLDANVDQTRDRAGRIIRVQR